jgi:tetratricopeptide (TPR) repeat protein
MMKTPLRLAAGLAALALGTAGAQVLPSGGGQPQPSSVDSSPKPQPQKSRPVLGDALPFMDPGSETVQWDGKMFSVTNNRVFRAMLETYLASPEAASAEDQAYRDVIQKILQTLSPNNNGGRANLPPAVALLPEAASYKQDAKLCESLANAIWGVWQAQRNVASLRQTNEQMQRRINEMHFHAEHHTAPLNQRSAQPAGGKGGGAAAQQQSAQSQAGQLGMVANYVKLIAENEVKMKANDVAVGISQATAKLEFQALIIQFAVQRRFEHVVMACRFYRNIFMDDPNGILQLNKGSDAEKMFATSLGTSPTVGALDAFANEMIGKVDTAVIAFDNLLARGDIASASQRISEAYMIGEYLPRVQRVPAAKKLLVLDYTRDSNQLISAMEVRDYTTAEAIVNRMRSKARDADESLIKAQQAIEVARGASDIYLNEAKVGAMKGDQAKSAEALKNAAEVWPTNPKLKEFTSMIGNNADVKTQAVLELDRLIGQRNFRQIYNDQGRYLAAITDDPGRQEQLKKVLTDMTKVNLAIAAAANLAKNGALPGAWETIERAFIEFPDDPEVARLRSDFSVKASEFVGALQKAKGHEERKQTGSAIAWYLKARNQYPRSEFASEGIDRLVQTLRAGGQGGE